MTEKEGPEWILFINHCQVYTVNVLCLMVDRRKSLSVKVAINLIVMDLFQRGMSKHMTSFTLTLPISLTLKPCTLTSLLTFLTLVSSALRSIFAASEYTNAGLGSLSILQN